MFIAALVAGYICGIGIKLNFVNGGGGGGGAVNSKIDICILQPKCICFIVQLI